MAVLSLHRRGRRQPPSIDWSLLEDGELRRFKRGKHYSGSPDQVQVQARHAAEDRDKLAVVYKDQLGKFEYVWVQFLDGKLEEGVECPKCASRSIERLQKYFFRCPSCRSVYEIDSTDSSGPDPRTVADITAVRMRSGQGEEIVQATIHDEIVMEAVCDFLRPVDRATLNYTFFTEGGEQKALRASCPDTIGVPDAQTVTFSLRVAAGLLAPDDYTVFPSIYMHLEPGADEIRVRKLEPFLFRVVDPDRDEAQDGGARERASLAWTIAMPSGEPSDDDD